jgi:hypothetical protein
MGRAATLRVDILADAKGVDRGVGQAESRLGKLGKVGKAAGIAAGAGLALAGAAALKFGADAVGAASEVQQSFGALDTVYGRNAAQVKKWAAGAADSVGLAKSEYANLSSLVGSQLQGMGVAQDKSAKQSNNLIKLGADLAATYGGSVKDAVGAVSSVLKGETDPIERYGVSIKAADVAARQAQLGLDGLTGKAAKQAKAQATLSLLTEQTTKAQGAFKRESGTLAGQQERLRAKFENVKAAVGKGLLPILTRFVGFLSNKVLPGAQRAGRQLAEKLGPAFRAVGRFITRDVVPAARTFIAWFQERIVPGIKRALVPVLESGKRAFDKVRDAIRDNRPQLEKIGNLFRRVAEFVADKVYPILGRLAGFMLGRLGDAISAGISVVSGLVDVFDNVAGAIRNVIEWLGKIKVPKALKAVGDGIGKIIPGSAELTTTRPQLAGRSSSYGGPTGLSTAALGSSAWQQLVRSPTPLAVGGVVIDARTYVRVDGALDADAVGRQLETILQRRNRRLGRTVVTL